ncbi:hypothetical protein BDW42DRAFT_393 [Aspergillus taichungensis]|uniref:Uncharacterized protein n=1 Tax=Aspergillus taichungensis TaxID=482145 RepID=A0A2J5I9V0_9EURO|nr:hypothetical protein BDW42DRAFT_393 [Aspergillus taichungensis]
MGLRSWIRRAKQKLKACKSKLKPNGDIFSPTTSPSVCAPIESVPDEAVTTQTFGHAPSSSVQARKPRPTSSETSVVPTSPDNNPFRPKHDFDLWTWAYKELFVRDRELMENYRKHLVSLQNDDALGAVDSASWSVKSVVAHLIASREKKQWSVSLFGTDIKI